MRAALFITCFNDTLFPEVGIATTRLLELLGCQVDFPPARATGGRTPSAVAAGGA
jgi:L-lactate dehydrogenase complex protein LldE